MNQLASIASNIFYFKNENGEYKKHYEIVLLIDKPKYNFTNEGDVVRERSLRELRFTVSNDNIDSLILSLNKIKDADHSEIS